MARPAWFQDSWFLVLGGTSGIGWEITKQLILHGGKVLSASKNEQEYQNIKQDPLSQHYLENMEYLQGDIRDDNFQNQLITQFLSKKPIRGIIHSIGIGVFGKYWELPLNVIQQVMDVNYRAGPLFIHRFLQAYFKTHSTHENQLFYLTYISSTTAETGIPFFGPYASTKAAMDTFFRSLKDELPSNIKTLIIRPGAVKTPFYETMQTAPQANLEKLMELTKGAFTTPEKVAKTLVKQLIKKKESIIYPDFKTKLQLKTLALPFIGKKLWKYYVNLLEKATTPEPNQ